MIPLLHRETAQFLRREYHRTLYHTDRAFLVDTERGRNRSDEYTGVVI